jgi:hypothetical protein
VRGEEGRGGERRGGEERALVADRGGVAWVRVRVRVRVRVSVRGEGVRCVQQELEGRVAWVEGERERGIGSVRVGEQRDHRQAERVLPAARDLVRSQPVPVPLE